MQELQTEVQDNIERTTEHFNGAVTTAGTPVVVSTGTNRAIQLLIIQNPMRGVRANGITDVLYISFDGTNYFTLERGSALSWSGKGLGTYNHQVWVDSNNNNVNYEILIVS